ncbi:MULTISPECIES: endonuclease/exonuclease/phosphatase family protein [Flavobacteriaceae]|uniref:endonuclease/exonuclease/phosphatase family protein n=1 Tax=Flavobacteriaceae TaxID=49546 RepID=UPI0014926D91|nr:MULTISPECIES: endonuclease/exonuclease/phosphatase family protein [Allomuricauda]MDC6365625.1 endonuclease/exonuclease/phosphatase family protein [Muricauda sp. AC10]
MKQTFWAILLLIGMYGQAQSISVLSYNIRYDNPEDGENNWKYRKEFLISQLKFFGPDVFGTQEGLINQLKDLDTGLQEYSYFGIGRDHGDDRGEFTAIFYNHNKFEVVEESTFWLSTTPDKPSKDWDAALPRICTYGHFKSKSNPSEFLLFNTHFDHRGKIAREKSAQLILEKIKQFNPKNLPVILMGDFNLESDSKGIQLITEQMLDTQIAAGSDAHGPKGTFNGFDFTKPVKNRIDYIFTSPENIKIIKSAILSDSFDCRYPSDHLPVYAELRLMAQ